MVSTLLVSALTGCDTRDEACALDSDEIAMDATIIDSPKGILAVVELREDEIGEGGEPLELCAEDGERILVNGREARAETFEYVTRYALDLDGPAPEYEIVYERDGGEKLRATVVIAMCPIRP